MGLSSRGRGVDPNAPQKRGFFRFFELFFRKFWDFTKISPIYAVFMLPIFVLYFLLSPFVLNMIGASEDSVAIVFFGYMTANLFAALFGGGPVTAGITYVMRNYATEKPAWIWSDFKDNAKSNFKQSLVVFLVDIAVFAISYVAIIVYSSLGGNFEILKYIVYGLLFIYTIMHFYIYQMMVTFELSLKDLYKNALLFALAKLPVNFFVLLVQIFLHMILPMSIILYAGNSVPIFAVMYILLEIFLFQALSAFITNFAVAKTIKETMLDKATD